jgi:magnesium transporter
MFSKDNVLIEELMNKNFFYVSPECDEEKVADLIIKHNIKAVPVIKKGVFLGVVPNDKIMTIINNSLTKDIIHFAGIHKSFLKYKNALEVPFFESVKQRLPWLLIGLFGIILAAGFISAFEELLGEHLIIASFIPAIVYMSGAIGSQHQTLLIRDITLMGKNMNLSKYFLKVISLGLALGIIIGLIIFSAISLFWNEPFLGIIIGFSIMITLIVSSISSFIITCSINRLKSDPATGSGPFATIISDVSSIMIYFWIVSLFLKI